MEQSENKKQEMSEVKERKIVSAIDIGTTKIVAIIGEKDENGRLKVHGMGKVPSIGVKKGVVLNIEQTINSIKEAVKIAETESGEKIDNVFVGIAGQYITSRRERESVFIENEEKEITIDDVNRLIAKMYKISTEPGQEILHVLPQSYIVDGEIDVEPVGMYGNKIEGNFHVVVGQSLLAKNIKKCITKAGLQQRDLILEPIASSRAVLTEEEKEVGVVLIDIGGGTSDIAIYQDGKIVHTAVIPFGGEIITADIKKELGIVEKNAEKLKMQYGHALPEAVNPNSYITLQALPGREPVEISQKLLAEIIFARMNEIIGAIKFEIDESNIESKFGAGVVLTGGGAQLKNIKQLMAYKLGMDVRIGTPNEIVVPDLSDELNKTMFATAIGLLLTGFDVVEKKLILNNLWNQEKVKENENQNEEKEEVKTDVKSKKKKNKEKRKKEEVDENKENFVDKLKGVIAGLFTEEDEEL